MSIKRLLYCLTIFILVTISQVESSMVSSIDTFASIEPWAFKPGAISFKLSTPSEAALDEWRQSAIAEDLIKLNLVSLPSYVSLSDKKISSYPMLDLIDVNYLDLLSSENMKLDFYKLDSSWTYLGYDPSTFKESQNFEIKPYPTLRENFKYENSSHKGFIKLPKISYRIANLIFPDLYDLTSIENTSLEAKDFWLNVSKSNVDIYLTEGYKKSLSLLSHGIVAIAIKGSCRGFSAISEGNARKITLSNDVNAILSWKPRKIFISFDTDSDDKLRGKVRVYTYNLAKKISESNRALDVKIVDIPEGSWKAADDLIFSYGFERYKNIAQNALTLEEYFSKYSPMLIEDFFISSEGDFQWCFNRCDGKHCMENFLQRANEQYNLEKAKFDSEFIKYRFNDVEAFVYKSPSPYAIEEWMKSSISTDMIDLNLISIPDLVFDKNRNIISYPLLDIIKLPYLDFLKSFFTSTNKSESKLWTYSGFRVDGSTEIAGSEIKMPPFSKIFTNKYEHSYEEPMITLPRVSNRIAKMILPNQYPEFKNQNEKHEAKDFWQKVFASNTPIVLTEGHKKALTLLSHGLVAISITQPCLGLKVNGSGKDRYLSINDDLKVILKQRKRTFYINFDTDKDSDVRKLVFSSVSFIADKIKKEGHDIKIIVLPEGGPKAPDDLIYEFGFEAYKKLYDNPLDLNAFRYKYPEDINTLFSKYLEDGTTCSSCFNTCYRSCLLNKIKSGV